MTDPSLRIPSVPQVGLAGMEFPELPSRGERRRKRAERVKQTNARMGAFQAMSQGRDIPSGIGAADPDITPKEPGMISKIFSLWDDATAPFAALGVYSSNDQSGQTTSNIFQGLGLPESISNTLAMSPNAISHRLGGAALTSLLSSNDPDAQAKEAERVAETGRILASYDRGELELGEAFRQLGNIQQSRPTLMQIGTGAAYDPTNLIPFGSAAKPVAGLRKILSGGKQMRGGSVPAPSAILEDVTADGVTYSGMRVSSPSSVIRVLHSPETGKHAGANLTNWMYSNPIVRKWIGETFNAAGIADWSMPNKRLAEFIMYYKLNSTTAAQGDLAYLLRDGKIVETVITPTGRVTISPSQISRKPSASLSKIQEGEIQPGGQFVDLPGERFGILLPDLFKGNITLKDIARRAGGGNVVADMTEAQTIARFAGYQTIARKDALRIILDGSGNKRRSILEHWGVSDPIRLNVDELSELQLDELLDNPEIMRRIDQELAQTLSAPSSSYKWMAENGFLKGGKSRKGEPVEPFRFLNEGDADNIFNRVSNDAIVHDEINLGALHGIEPTNTGITRGAFGYARQRDNIGFMEVMQNKEWFVFHDPRLERLVDDFSNLINQEAQHLVDIGAIAPEGFLNAVSGQYSSAIWDTIDRTVRGQYAWSGGKWIPKPNLAPIRMDKRAPELLGQRKTFEHERVRDYISDNMDRGFGEAPIEEQLFHTLLMLKQIEAEKMIFDVGGAWTRPLRKRMKEGHRVFGDDLLDVKAIPKEVLADIQDALGGKTNKFAEAFSNLNAASRSLTAGYDLGAPMIHGLPLFFTDSRAWGNATKFATRAMLDRDHGYKYIYENLSYFREMQMHNGISVGDAEFVEALTSGGILNRQFEKLSNVKADSLVGQMGGQFVGKQAAALSTKVGAHFNFFLVGGKIEMYKSLRPSAMQQARKEARKKSMKAGIREDSPEFGQYLATEETEAVAALSEHVSKFMGAVDMANMGLRPSRAKLLSAFVMFAPRYRMSVMGAITDVLRDGGTYRGSMARERLARMGTSAVLWYSYIAHNLDQEPELNPLHSNFMKIKVGNTYIGVGSAFKSAMKFMASLVAMPAGSLMEATNHDPEEEWLQDIKNDHRIENLTKFKDNAVLKFLRSGSAPTTSATWSVITGSTFVGDPLAEEGGGIDLSAVAPYAMPFWLSGMAAFPRQSYGQSWAGLLTQNKDADGNELPWGNTMDKLMGIGSGVIMSGISEAGGLQSYPVSPREKGKALAQEQINIFLEQGKLKVIGDTDPTWNDLNRVQRNMVLNGEAFGAEIQRQFSLEDKIWSGRGDPVKREINKYWDRRNAIIDKRNADIEEWTNKFENGITHSESVSGEDLREKIKDLYNDSSAQLKLLDAILSQEAIDYQEERKQRRLSDKEDVSLYDDAYEDYISTVVAPDFEAPDGGFDHRAYDAAKSAWYQAWTGTSIEKEAETDPIVQYVNGYMSRGWNNVMKELRIGQKDLRPYWDVHQNIMSSMGWDSAQMSSVYDNYLAADGIMKSRMKLIYPWITEVETATREARRMMRMSNPKLDHFLIRWGYVTSSVHPSFENVDPIVIANHAPYGRIWE